MDYSNYFGTGRDRGKLPVTTLQDLDRGRRFAVK